MEKFLDRTGKIRHEDEMKEGGLIRTNSADMVEKPLLRRGESFQVHLKMSKFHSFGGLTEHNLLS